MLTLNIQTRIVKSTLMSASPHLHAVSFQVPFPPTYGGIIDVYYKLQALKTAGCRITLHTYRYRCPEAPALADVADRVLYYERATGPTSMLSTLPYIVYSRRNPRLLEALTADNAPILFEGLHTCFFLNHPALRDRFKIVRTHNIEHAYYAELAKAAPLGYKHTYYRMEAAKLRRYEPQLRHADALLAITPDDRAYFAKQYPEVRTEWMPCFYDNHRPNPTADTTEPYVLYHANLAVAENVRAAVFLLDEIVPRLRPGTRVVLAGKAPAEGLKRRAARHPNVRMVADPDQPTMEHLIAQARVNVLLTFQSTGIKLKLLHALAKGHGHCLVNTPMLTDGALASLCTVADTPADLAAAIERMLAVAPSRLELEARATFLRTHYDPAENARRILDLLP